MYYDKYETDISEKYLQKILAFRGIVLIGGWAVYIHVNKNFRKARGRNYSGSRDIDLGFHMDAKWDDDELKNSAFFKLSDHLNKNGFEWQGFRMLKNFHTETEKELSLEESKKLYAYNIFPLYVDLIVDFIHPKFKDVFGFIPIDEPLLKYVFENNKYCKNIRLFGAEAILPTPDLLLAMKLNSLPGRDKEHKRIKDISDIFALLFFSEENLEDIKEKLFSLYEKEKATNIIKNITDKDISSVAEVLGFDFAEVKRVFIEFIK